MNTVESALIFAKTNWSLFLPFLGGILSAMSCRKGDYQWMRSLKRPSFDPPVWVWACCNLLYMATGYAINLVWLDAKARKLPSFEPFVAFFWISLVTNLLWTPVFMRFRKMLAASILSTVSVICGALSAYYGFQINEVSAKIMVAYVGFFTFATAVSFSTYLLNQPRKLRINKTK